MICESSPQARYVRFDEVLGKGAYKTVYRAYDTREGVEVAWNSVNLNGIPKHEKARIINEVKLLDKLEHENIIDFYGSWVNREREQVIQHVRTRAYKLLYAHDQLQAEMHP